MFSHAGHLRFFRAMLGTLEEPTDSEAGGEEGGEGQAGEEGAVLQATAAAPPRHTRHPRTPARGRG